MRLKYSNAKVAFAGDGLIDYFRNVSIELYFLPRSFPLMLCLQNFDNFPDTGIKVFLRETKPEIVVDVGGTTCTVCLKSRTNNI